MLSITSVCRKNVMVPFFNKICFRKIKNENPAFSGRLRLSSPPTPLFLKLPTTLRPLNTFSEEFSILLNCNLAIKPVTNNAYMLAAVLISIIRIKPNILISTAADI
jgi:hypothetical protein